MDSDGSNVLRLTLDDFDEGHPSWTPVGTKIAFATVRWDLKNVEIYVMDADGNDPINLTNHNWQDVRPSWSPDGRKIAFESYRDGGFNTPHHIFVMNADGSARRNLTGRSHPPRTQRVSYLVAGWTQDCLQFVSPLRPR